MIRRKSGAFFQKGIKQANKKLFKPYRVSKKWKKGLILVQKLWFIDMIRILGLLKSFAFVMRSKCEAFFKKGKNKLNRGCFSHIECPKNAKWPYFGAKIDVYWYDQNSESPDKFCLCDAEQKWSLFSIRDRTS